MTVFQTGSLTREVDESSKLLPQPAPHPLLMELAELSTQAEIETGAESGRKYTPSKLKKDFLRSKLECH
jgi:hypothetical protein